MSDAKAKSKTSETKKTPIKTGGTRAVRSTASSDVGKVQHQLKREDSNIEEARKNITKGNRPNKATKNIRVVLRPRASSATNVESASDDSSGEDKSSKNKSRETSQLKTRPAAKVERGPTNHSNKKDKSTNKSEFDDKKSTEVSISARISKPRPQSAKKTKKPAESKDENESSQNSERTAAQEIPKSARGRKPRAQSAHKVESLPLNGHNVTNEVLNNSKRTEKTASDLPNLARDRKQKAQPTMKLEREPSIFSNANEFSNDPRRTEAGATEVPKSARGRNPRAQPKKSAIMSSNDEQLSDVYDNSACVKFTRLQNNSVRSSATESNMMCGNKNSRQATNMTKLAEDELNKRLKNRIDELIVQRNDRQKCTWARNIIVESVKTYLNEHRLKWTVDNSGSNAEGTKIQKPDEFDVIFVLEDRFVPSYSNQREHLQFCSFKRITKDYKPDYDKFCVRADEDSFIISPKLFKSYFKDLIKPLFNLDEGFKIKEKHRDDYCPAVTIDVKSRHFEFSMDLVPAVRIKKWPTPALPFLTKHSWVKSLLPDSKQETVAVAKIHHSEYTKDPKQCRYFRISFSKQERIIMLHADGTANDKDDSLQDENVKTCRKTVYKLLKQDLKDCPCSKVILEGKETELLSSYSIKTVMLHLYHKRSITEWTLSSENKSIVRERYLNALEDLCDALLLRKIDHFFISDVNILPVAGQNISEERRKKLLQYFQSKRSEYSLNFSL